ncbi:MAG TPA: hydrogenase maturation nickel metallochaperone HypA [Bacteroidales bacterium]|nr:hydrogenase maturation nickel metallochaperone HypA [Bacteroidales bacterium]
MHELSIAVQIAEIITEEAAKAEALTVTKVILEIGSLSGIEADAIELAVPEAFRNTICENAAVEYHYIKARAVCESCCNEFDPIDHYKICPFCNSLYTSFLKGKELNIKSFDIVKP